MSGKKEARKPQDLNRGAANQFQTVGWVSAVLDLEGRFGKLAGLMKHVLQLTMLWLLAAGFAPLWRLGAQEAGAIAAGKATAEQVSLEREVEQGRGLKFLRPVAYRSMKSAEFKGFLKKKIRGEYTPQEICDYSRALGMIGLVPEGVDFEAKVMEVMDEQVAAFFDQDAGLLYTFADSPLQGNLNLMILAHELTHVLQDQHFHLKQWPLKRKDNDDLVTAHLAVLEGDATIVMEKVYKRMSKLRTTLTDLSNALAQDTGKLQRAPRYFRDMLLFPYQEGRAFIEELERMGGPELVNSAFRSPPATTAQVLHPKKFHPKREEPLPSAPDATAEPGWRRLSVNTVGEFGMIVLLRQFDHESDAAALAEGWRGDGYVAFETGGGNGLLRWRSEWASSAAAKRFANAYRDVITKRNAHRRPALALELKESNSRVDVTLRVPATAGDPPVGVGTK
ncbi:MAG: hypothetical protein WCV00_13170 [Verrucomicrobiia bacterium]|jgi:hypothetical protein